MMRALLLVLLAGLLTPAWAAPLLVPLPAKKDVTCLLPTASGIWAAVYNDGIWRYAHGAWRRVSARNPERYTYDLTVGPDSRIYCATWMGEGITALDPRTGRRQVYRWDFDRPGFDRGDTRATHIVSDGTHIIVQTEAGLVRLEGGAWRLWAGLPGLNHTLYAAPDGVWALLNWDLIRISRAGMVTQRASLNGVVLPQKDTDVSALWADRDHVLFGDTTGVLRAYFPRTKRFAVVTAPPAPKLMLTAILPVGNTIYLAYSGYDEHVGRVAQYDRLTGRLSTLDDFSNARWSTLARVGDDVWVGGNRGLARLPRAATRPVPARVDGLPRMLLPDAMRVALYRAHPDFTPCAATHFSHDMQRSYPITDHQTLTGVTGDYNGDGRPDAVIEGHTGAGLCIFVLLSTPNSYRVVPMGDGSDEGTDHFTCLTYNPPGLYRSDWEPKPVRLAHDAFTVEADGKASVLYYWSGRKFVEYITGD